MITDINIKNMEEGQQADNNQNKISIDEIVKKTINYCMIIVFITIYSFFMYMIIDTYCI
jgi:hypothetical protein